jgi:hypothetical protein
VVFNGGCTGACYAIDVYSTATVEKLSFRFEIKIDGDFLHESSRIEFDINCGSSSLSITPSFSTDQVWNVNYGDNSGKYFEFAPFTVSPAACFVGSTALTYEMSYDNVSNSAVSGMTLGTCNTVCTSGKKFVRTNSVNTIATYDIYIYAYSPGQSVEIWSPKITYSVVCTSTSQIITWGSYPSGINDD